MKIDPWGSQAIKDYEKLLREFGIRSFFPLLKRTKDPSLLMKRGVIFGHRDFDKILDCIDERKNYAMMTGLMPSGKFHFGHKILAEQFPWHQKNGAELFIAVADIEAHTVRKIPLDKLRKIAVDEYLLNYIALGLKPKKCHFYFQSDYCTPYYVFSKIVSKYPTYNELKAIYGRLSPAKITSVLLQVADILHPQLKEYGGKRHVVVPVGVDQDPHIRFTRDIASKSELGLIPPSSTYHQFMMGLDGGKMSSSRPESYIALTEPVGSAVRKLSSALTGGRDTLAEQRKKGGVPEKCAVYEFFMIHLEPSDKKLKERYERCKSGKLMCGECKGDACDLLRKFLLTHRKKREKAKNKISRYLQSAPKCGSC